MEKMISKRILTHLIQNYQIKNEILIMILVVEYHKFLEIMEIHNKKENIMKKNRQITKL